MAIAYPFFDAVEGEELEQGDILLQCPVYQPIPDLTYPLADDNLEIDILTVDVIIMTQSCDLANDKVNDVIVCPHFDLSDVGQQNSDLARKDVQKQILNGYRHRYSIIAPSDAATLAMSARIVDFGRIYSLPKSFVKQFASRQGLRLRLNPPYREHLSQSFARFFMRVGLPQNIELPK